MLLRVVVDPGHPIPPEVSAAHHIVDEDSTGFPKWKGAVADLLRTPDFDPSINVLVAHSAKFERHFITDEVTGGLRASLARDGARFNA